MNKLIKLLLALICIVIVYQLIVSMFGLYAGYKAHQNIEIETQKAIERFEMLSDSVK